MGQALLRLASTRDDCTVVAAVSAQSPSQRVVDGVPHFSADELSGVPAFDIAIDFSLPVAFDTILRTCVERGAGLLSGTTGIDEAQRAALSAASTHIPVIWASNYSLGVAVIEDLVARAASALQDWDCDIVESHHTQKLDAPSGTALTLGAAAAQGGAQARYASIRAGDIVGEHSVQFATAGERIELIHRASNRDIFARGALHAAVKLNKQPAGAYRLAELL